MARYRQDTRALSLHTAAPLPRVDRQTFPHLYVNRLQGNAPQFLELNCPLLTHSKFAHRFDQVNNGHCLLLAQIRPGSSNRCSVKSLASAVLVPPLPAKPIAATDSKRRSHTTGARRHHLWNDRGLRAQRPSGARSALGAGALSTSAPPLV